MDERRLELKGEMTRRGMPVPRPCPTSSGIGPSRLAVREKTGMNLDAANRIFSVLADALLCAEIKADCETDFNTHALLMRLSDEPEQVLVELTEEVRRAVAKM